MPARRQTRGNRGRTSLSHVAALGTKTRVTAASQRRLERIFRHSLRKKGGRWTITDATKFKFSLFRMRPKPAILNRIAPLLHQRPDLSWVLSSYIRKFPQNKQAADALHAALQRDPTYDASAANYIEAMDVCEPAKGAGADTAGSSRQLNGARRKRGCYCRLVRPLSVAGGQARQMR